MLFFERRKKKDKRSHNERRAPNNALYNGPDHRSETERRKNRDRRHAADRRSGLYHKLSDQRKTTLDGILNKLEDLLDEEKYQ